MSTSQVRWTVFVVLMIVLSASSLAITSTLTPGGAETITIDATSRKIPANGTQIPALAGNVSQIMISGYSVTQMWQGYYGNISGGITLADSSGYQFLNWTLANPEGEIYASMNSSIDWSRIECYNISAAKTVAGSGPNFQQAYYLNMSEFEGDALGARPDDVDGVDETFATKFTGEFYVGNIRINTTDECYKVHTFIANQSQSSNFTEVILIQDDGTPDWYTSGCNGPCGGDGVDNSIYDIIWASIIHERGSAGFNNQVWDFQMVVGENGHNGDTTPTNYYFYLEIS